MLFLRSLLFNIAVYILLFGLVVFGAPVMFFGRHGVFALARTWARATFWLQRVICGVHVEFRGVEHVPKGAFILAAKHQSVWETFALTLFAPDYSFLLKRELTWIPDFGWMLISSEQIMVDRAKGGSALMQAVRARALLDGRLAPSTDDVVALAGPVLRHRMALNFSARAEGATTASVIERLCKSLF